MIKESSKTNGFTLVELMLAMAFASVLLVAIAMTVIQIGNIYEKGITLKETNQAGRAISNELQQNINNNQSFKLVLCTATTTTCNYVIQSSGQRPWGGRLCIGDFSYIWNTGGVINGTFPGANKNIYTSPNDTTIIRFVKVIDPSADYCTHSTRSVSYSNATELLSKSQRDLAIHGFSISQSGATDTRTGQSLYNVNFLLGTNGVATVDYHGDNVTDPSCKTPDQAGSDQIYCSINKFNILTRAGSVSE